MGKYLVLGALIAAAVQTFVQTSTLLAIGQGQIFFISCYDGTCLYIITLFRGRCIYRFFVPKYVFNSFTCRVPRLHRWWILKICL